MALATEAPAPIASATLGRQGGFLGSFEKLTGFTLLGLGFGVVVVGGWILAYVYDESRDGSDVVWDLIRAALMSVADYAIFPVQDILNLGSEARMNSPGRPDGNWTWRLKPGQLTGDVLRRLGELTHLYAR